MMNLEPFINKDLFWYLATPYTKYKYGHEVAFKHAAQVTGKLLMYGLKKVFSPIVHCHPVAYESFINPTNNAIWLDEEGLLCTMMNVCDGLLVVPMPGYAESFGINFEIERFTSQYKPVYMLPSDVLPTELLENDQS